MSKDAAELMAAVATTATAVLVLIGLAVRLVLYPWLKEHLVTPLLTRLDTLSSALENTSRDVSVAARMFEGHIEASGEDRGRLWDAVEELRRYLPRRHRSRTANATHRREDTP
jgi:hypothetical protein